MNIGPIILIILFFYMPLAAVIAVHGVTNKGIE